LNILTLIVLLSLVSASPIATGSVEIIEGIARRLPEQVEVYREQHRIQDQRHRISYQRLDGSLFAETILDYRDSDSAPAWEQHDLRDGTRIGGRWDGQRYVLTRDAESESITPATDLVASAGFDRFVRQYWHKLHTGTAIEFEFALPARLSAHRMQIRRREADPRFPDADIWFQVRPAQPLLRLFVHPIALGYDAAQQLRVYRGISNLRDDAGKPLVVEIRYSTARQIESALLHEAAAPSRTTTRATQWCCGHRQ
jgi:hypothetical protein